MPGRRAGWTAPMAMRLNGLSASVILDNWFASRTKVTVLPRKSCLPGPGGVLTCGSPFIARRRRPHGLLRAEPVCLQSRRCPRSRPDAAASSRKRIQTRTCDRARLVCAWRNAARTAYPPGRSCRGRAAAPFRGLVREPLPAPEQGANGPGDWLQDLQQAVKRTSRRSMIRATNPGAPAGAKMSRWKNYQDI